MTVHLDTVPEAHRDTVRAVFDDAFGAGAVERVDPGPTGASGALTFKVATTAGDHLLRIEGARMPGRNPHQYRNLEAAAAASIAPPVRLVDEDRGVLVMEWIDAKPLTDHPGGPVALVEAVGTLVSELQGIAAFPAHDDWADVITRMLGFAQMTGRLSASVADPVGEAFTRIREAWPRDPSGFVPAHNDPNATNILFDGDRLWLVDWETSAPNDPLVDLAVAANQLAPVPELRDALLTAWRGRAPDDVLRARLGLAQLGAQLFAGCAIALVTASLGGDPIEDFEAPSPEEFQARVMSGQLSIGTAETMTTFAKVVLSQFRQQTSTPEFEAALRTSADG